MDEKSIHQINAEHLASLGLKNPMDYHKEGQAAYKAGAKFYANPYAKPSGSQVGYQAWGAGWMAAYQKANNHG